MIDAWCVWPALFTVPFLDVTHAQHRGTNPSWIQCQSQLEKVLHALLPSRHWPAVTAVHCKKSPLDYRAEPQPDLLHHIQRASCAPPRLAQSHRDYGPSSEWNSIRANGARTPGGRPIACGS